METIGSRMQQAAQEEGMSLRELARGLGVSASGLSRYFRDLREPTCELVIRFAELTNSSLLWLMTGNHARAHTETVPMSNVVHLGRDAASCYHGLSNMTDSDLARRLQTLIRVHLAQPPDYLQSKLDGLLEALDPGIEKTPQLAADGTVEPSRNRGR